MEQPAMTTDTVEVVRVDRDLPLTLTVAGSGPPVFVVHGGHGPGNSRILLDHFAPTSQVLLPTHPGWDGTPRPEWLSGVDDLALLYLDLLDDRDLTEVSIVATSFGGWVASEMAVRDRGHRISRLVLIDAIGPEVPGHQVQVPAGRGPGGQPPIMQVVYAYTGPDMNDPKLLRRLGRVRIPTLVLWGEDDAALSPEFGRIYASAFSNGRFQVIPNAGHIPLQDAPAATLAAITAFLAEGRTP
jgi:pimeloyl-ACP methyl ester carboxylesterase